MNSFYLDILPISRYLGTERLYHHTAPVSMLYALHEGLRIVLEEGMEARWQRHEEMGAEVLAALEDRGLEPLPPPGYRLPEGICARLTERLADRVARKRMFDEV